MAYGPLGGLIQFPPAYISPGTAPGVTAFTAMTASGFQSIFIFTIPESGTIAYLGLRCVASTTGVVTVGLQTVGTNGEPTGAAYGGSAASGNQSIAANTGYEIALTTPASAVKGDIVAYVVSYVSGTTMSVARDTGMTLNSPYMISFNSSAYAFSNFLMCATLGYSSFTSYVPLGGATSGYVPISGSSAAVESYISTAYNNTGTFRRALQITAPCDMTVEGCWVIGTWATSAELVMNLYASNGTNQSSSTPLTGTNPNYAVMGGTTVGVRFLNLTAPVNLTHGSIYYLSQEPQTSANFTDYENAFSTVAWQYSNPINNLPGGINCILATGGAASGGNITWTPTTTRRPLCGVLASQFALSSSSGGILYPPGLSGGLG